MALFYYRQATPQPFLPPPRHITAKSFNFDVWQTKQILEYEPTRVKYRVTKELPVRIDVDGTETIVGYTKYDSTLDTNHFILKE